MRDVLEDFFGCGRPGAKPGQNRPWQRYGRLESCPVKELPSNWEMFTHKSGYVAECIQFRIVRTVDPVNKSVQ